jgi:hypothetical protein
MVYLQTNWCTGSSISGLMNLILKMLLMCYVPLLLQSSFGCLFKDQGFTGLIHELVWQKQHSVLLLMVTKGVIKFWPSYNILSKSMFGKILPFPVNGQELWLKKMSFHPKVFCYFTFYVAKININLSAKTSCRNCSNSQFIFYFLR